VSDLLDVAKIGDNRIDLVPKEVDLDDILNDCADLIRSRIKSGVNFIVDIPMPEYKVKIDDQRVKQIFINLLSIAVKFYQRRGSIGSYVDGGLRTYSGEWYVGKLVGQGLDWIPRGNGDYP